MGGTMIGTKLVAFVEATGIRVRAGDVVRDFRGDGGTFVKSEAPRVPGKSGKVMVIRDGGNVVHNYDSVWGIRVEWLPQLAPDSREHYWTRVADAARDLTAQLTTWAPGPQDTALYHQQFPENVAARLDILEQAIKGWGAR
jgi:hypothetical protein